ASMESCVDTGDGGQGPVLETAGRGGEKLRSANGMPGDIHLHAAGSAATLGTARLPRDGRAGRAHLSLPHRGLREVSVRQGMVFPLDAAAVFSMAGTALWLASSADRANLVLRPYVAVGLPP